MKKIVKGLVITTIVMLAVWMLASYTQALNNSLTIGATVSEWNFFTVMGNVIG